MNILFVRNSFKVEDSAMQSKRINEGMGLYPPVALCHLAGVARKMGHNIGLIDGAAEDLTEKEFIDKIVEFAPDLVCFSLWTVMFKADVKMAAPIKERVPGVRIAIGGPHCDIYSEVTMRAYPEIDFAAQGEGEVTFAELVEALSKDEKDFSAINGLYWRKDGAIVANSIREKMKNLDDLPYPAIDLLSLEKYHSIMAKNDRPIYILTTRGCPFKCAYCVDQQFGRSVRYHSPDYVIGYWKWLVEELGVNEVHVYDDTFTLNKKRTLEICRRLEEEGLNKASWTVRTRVDTINEEIIDALWSSGCYRIGYGVESGSQKILDLMIRDQTVEKVREAFALTRRHPFEIVANFMIGYMGEDKKTYNETVKLALELDPDFAYFSITHAEPNTDLYHQALDQELIKEDVWNDYILGKVDYIDPKNNVFTNSAYSLEDLKKMQSWAYLRFYMRPHKIWRQAKKVKSLDMFWRKAKMAIGMVVTYVENLAGNIGSGKKAAQG